MATTTPNYGWTVPTSTDLVKDGATAIETLGDAIDASMNTALGTKKAGMVLLNTTSFSAVSSQQVNNVFSATYKNYRAVINIDSASASTFLRYRFNTSGTDNTNNNYVGTLVSAQWTGTVFTNDNLGTSTVGTLGYLATSAQSSMTVDIFNPFGAFNSGVSSLGFRGDSFGTWASGWFSTTTSFTGFTLLPSSGTITGQIQIFGVNQ